MEIFLVILILHILSGVSSFIFPTFPNQIGLGVHSFNGYASNYGNVGIKIGKQNYFVKIPKAIILKEKLLPQRNQQQPSNIPNQYQNFNDYHRQHFPNDLYKNHYTKVYYPSPAATGTPNLAQEYPKIQQNSATNSQNYGIAHQYGQHQNVQHYKNSKPSTQYKSHETSAPYITQSYVNNAETTGRYGSSLYSGKPAVPTYGRNNENYQNKYPGNLPTYTTGPESTYNSNTLVHANYSTPIHDYSAQKPDAPKNYHNQYSSGQNQNSYIANTNNEVTNLVHSEGIVPNKHPSNSYYSPGLYSGHENSHQSLPVASYAYKHQERHYKNSPVPIQYSQITYNNPTTTQSAIYAPNNYDYSQKQTLVSPQNHEALRPPNYQGANNIANQHSSENMQTQRPLPFFYGNLLENVEAGASKPYYGSPDHHQYLPNKESYSTEIPQLIYHPVTYAQNSQANLPNAPIDNYAKQISPKYDIHNNFKSISVKQVKPNYDYGQEYTYAKSYNNYIPINYFSHLIKPAVGAYDVQFQTGNGIKHHESGYMKPLQVNGDKNYQETSLAHVKTGTISWTSPEGIPFSMSYIADEHGFRPTGSHIPSVNASPSSLTNQYYRDGYGSMNYEMLSPSNYAPSVDAVGPS